MPETNPGTTGLVYLGGLGLADQTANGGLLNTVVGGGTFTNAGPISAIGNNKYGAYLDYPRVVELDFSANGFSSEYTFSCWVYFDVASYGFPYQQNFNSVGINSSTPAYSAGGAAIQTNAWGSSAFGVFAQVNFGGTIPAQTWTHIVGQAGSSWIATYKNGTLGQSRTDRSLAYTIDGQYLGSNDSSAKFKGYFIEPSVWSRRLSVDEISWLANSSNTLLSNLSGSIVPILHHQKRRR